MYRRLLVCALVAVAAGSLLPLRAPAADPKILELQRDVAGLQEQVRLLKESQDKQLAALTELVRQALDSSTKSNTGMAVIQDNLRQSLKDVESKVSTPVAGLSTRLDSIDQDMRALQQSVAESAGLTAKLQQQMTDVQNAVKILAQPAPPPPSASGQGTGGTAATPDIPTISAQDLYANANRDRSGGKPDLALQEFQDYLRWYGNTDLAVNAQFWIGTIHYNQGDFDNATKDFDMVLEHYPEGNKTPDALFQKGLALQKMGRLTDGANEFSEIIKRYPTSPLAAKACDQRKSMGLGCGVSRTTTAPAKGTSKKKR